MEPKFQSSFIPKGPVAAASPLAAQYAKPKTTIFGFISTLLFILALVLSLGVFGYERYLLSDIGTMGSNLSSARATLQPDTIKELVNANKRIIGTRALLSKHTALSPFFDYLESATLRSVRYTQFLYVVDQNGLELTMHGQAQSYQDVALQSDAFNRSGIFKNPVFSDLDLDSKGNVTFTFRATLDPAIVSYQKRLQVLPAAATLINTASSTATTTQKTASTATTTTTKTATSTATTTKTSAH